jgi:hypothetical protein
MKSMRLGAMFLTIAVFAAGASACADDKAPSTEAVSADEASIQTIKRDLAPVLNRSTDGLVVQAVPGGGQRVDLGGRFQSAAIAKIGPDGKLVTDCVDSVDQAEAFLRDGAQAQAVTKASDR